LYLGVFTEVCIFLFALFVLVIGGIRLVALTLILGQTSAALQVPLGYVYLALPLSGLLIMFYSVGAVARQFVVSREGEDGTGGRRQVP
jgi:TRAP-type C4-dicarboxylate transport system permease small subunit